MNIENLFIALFVIWHFRNYGPITNMYLLFQKMYFFIQEQYEKQREKQKLEETTLNPIICIGNYHIDKKIKELMKVCNVIELKTPTSNQISEIIKILISNGEFLTFKVTFWGIKKKI